MPKGVYPRKSKLGPPKRKRGRPRKVEVVRPEHPGYDPMFDRPADLADMVFDPIGGAMEEFCGMTTRFWTDFGERMAGQVRSALRGD